MNILHKLLSFLLVLIIGLLSSGEVIAKDQSHVLLPNTGAITSKMIYDKVGLKKNKLVETTLPDEKTNFGLAGSTNHNLSFWIKQLDKKDYHKDGYIVLPNQGLIMPLGTLTLDHSIYKEYMKGKDKKLNELMTRGAVSIPLTGFDLKFGANGNKIIGGHSSYFKNNKIGKYKTHFQKIIGLEKDEEIWIYKNIPGTKEYMRYVYKVTNSFNNKSNNFEIIEDKKDRITLFTCTPIGGISGRWIVEAEYVSKNKTE